MRQLQLQVSRTDRYLDLNRQAKESVAKQTVAVATKDQKHTTFRLVKRSRCGLTRNHNFTHVLKNNNGHTRHNVSLKLDINRFVTAINFNSNLTLMDNNTQKHTANRNTRVNHMSIHMFRQVQGRYNKRLTLSVNMLFKTSDNFLQDLNNRVVRRSNNTLLLSTTGRLIRHVSHANVLVYNASIIRHINRIRCNLDREHIPKRFTNHTRRHQRLNKNTGQSERIHNV